MSKTRLLIGGFTRGNQTPFHSHRVLLGPFFFIGFNQFTMEIYLGYFSRGKIGYTGKCNISQGNLIFTWVKLTRVATANNSCSSLTVQKPSLINNCRSTTMLSCISWRTCRWPGSILSTMYTILRGKRKHGINCHGIKSQHCSAFAQQKC